MKTLLITLLVTLTFPLLAADDGQYTIRAQGGTGYQINNLRTFEINESTSFKMDGNDIPQPNAQGGTGYKIRYSVTDTNPNLTSGTLEGVDFINIYKGPVLSKSPFNVFNIEGLISNKTHFANGLVANDLLLGDSVLISGYIVNDSSSIITRIEKIDSLVEWKISGYVENYSANQFTINNQLIHFSSNVIGSCNASLANGEFVEIFAEPILDFQSNDFIDTVTLINCVDRSLRPTTADGTVIVEGMIDATLVDGGFIISGQNVVVDHSTRYIRGRAEDVQEKIKVEIEGTVDDVFGVITADKVRFMEDRINLTLPVEPSDFNFPIFNVAGVNLKVPPQVLDPDGVIANGINKTTQLQFKGYNNGDGELFVTRINVRGSVDYDGVNLDGNVSVIANPIIDLFGVSFDTDQSDFYDSNGMKLSSVEFFNVLTVGSKVFVENASLESNTGLISGGVVTIDELALGKLNQNTLNKNGGSTVLGVGHITNLSDGIFKTAFE